MSSGVLSLVLSDQRSEIARLMDRVEVQCREWGLSEDDTVNLNLILDEFVSNVIRHGYDDGRAHEIHVAVGLAGDVASIRIEDDGRPFNPLDAPPPDLDLPIEQRPIGGLGIFIARALADSIEYRRERDHNVLTMTKKVGRT
jgi:anti-sigma regulatory factor (Ser/Thr protein kinase)